MDLTDHILTRLVPDLKKAGPENVILGQPDHVRRTPKQFPAPGYIEHHTSRHYVPELCYCLKGKFVMRLGDFHYRLQAHDVCVVRRNLYHHESFALARNGYEVIWLAFGASIRELIILHFRYTDQRYEKVQSLHVRVPGEFTRHLDAMVDKYNFWDTVKKELDSVGVIIGDRMGQPRGTYRLKDSEQKRFQYVRMLRAAGYIMEHACEDMHLKDVAAHVGLNPNNLERVLHQNAGITFLKLRTSCRLWKALDYFNQTNKNISQIAYDCGFTDALDFSRVFKKYFGLSPRAFRDKYTL